MTQSSPIEVSGADVMDAFREAQQEIASLKLLVRSLGRQLEAARSEVELTKQQTSSLQKTDDRKAA